MSEQERFFRTLNRALTILFFIIMVHETYRMFGGAMDATDKSAFERSGMKLLIDYETGVHYLSDGKGGFMERQGDYMSKKKEADK